MDTSTRRFKALCLATSAFMTTMAITPAFAGATRTPIEHVIIIIGENHTFDNLFGTYKPRAGQTIDNLLSKGIVNEDGTPGPNFSKAEQRIGLDEARYSAETASVGAYATLPQPYTTYGIGLPQGEQLRNRRGLSLVYICPQRAVKHLDEPRPLPVRCLQSKRLAG